MLAFDDVTAMTGRLRTGTGAALLIALLATAGCSGMEPYEPRNNREEGPEKGLLTGEQGEFVIFRLRSKPKGEGEAEAEESQDDTEEQE